MNANDLFKVNNDGNLIVYKLFRIDKFGNLRPLYVNANEIMEQNVWIEAKVGPLVDEIHVKASGCGGKLSLRPGLHSGAVPCADWIGKRDKDGTLMQRKDTVWCECEVRGSQIEVTQRYGLRTIPEGWYFFKTNSRQEYPWVISKWIKINKVLSNKEVDEICAEFGIVSKKREIA